ncbi:MAG TPA: TraB/GumN family protein, partial [Allosphingosinicella sp.]|nr:TraB/GumN family protein [Allosphingosinicella sp.]
AAAPTDADPALWVVRDEDTIVYLFGTFHLLDSRPWFNDEVRTAFDSSDELVVEAIVPEDPAELQPLLMRYAVDPQGRRLSQRLSAEQNAALGRALALLGAPPGAFDRLEPWFVSLTLSAVASQQLGISAKHGPEGVLVRAARARAMPVTELEGIEWQIRLFDDMPDEQQLAQLRQALDELDNLGRSLAPMLAAWSSGDVDGLVTIINQHGEQDPALHRLLFTARNATWANWIEQRLARPGTVFLAVGAGHLAGGDSVQAALQRRGHSVERVPHREDPPES